MDKQLLSVVSVLVVAIELGCAACATGEQMQRRIVRSPADSGILLAPDLPTLNALLTPNVAPPSNVVMIPDRTKGRALDRKFFSRGSFVDPYPASGHDLERDGVVEVVLFEVTEGPQRGLKGWVQAAFLLPDFKYL